MDMWGAYFLLQHFSIQELQLTHDRTIMEISMYVVQNAKKLAMGVYPTGFCLSTNGKWKQIFNDKIWNVIDIRSLMNIREWVSQ